MTIIPDTQSLQDRAAIHDVLTRYFHGADSCDQLLVRSCFTSDVQAKLEGRPKVRGIDGLIEQMAVFGHIASGAWTVTTHFMGSVHFRRLERHEADTETYAFAFLVAPDGDGSKVRMRSLRYVDRLVRVGDGWKIATRLHTLDWSCEVPCDFARAFAQRQNAIPAN